MGDCCQQHQIRNTVTLCVTVNFCKCTVCKTPPHLWLLSTNKDHCGLITAASVSVEYNFISLVQSGQTSVVRDLKYCLQWRCSFSQSRQSARTLSVRQKALSWGNCQDIHHHRILVISCAHFSLLSFNNYAVLVIFGQTQQIFHILLYYLHYFV